MSSVEAKSSFGAVNALFMDFCDSVDVVIMLSMWSSLMLN